MKSLFNPLKKHLAAGMILAVSLVCGLWVFGDFGISWDEPHQRDIGLKSFEYIMGRDRTLNDFKNRDYGVAVELPLILIEKAAGLDDTRDIYRMRHLVVHLFFLFCAFGFYLLIWNLYKNRLLAVTGLLLLLLSPRIYAQSFFNSKDIPFMCMFILGFLLMAVSFRDHKVRQFMLLGIISGFLINIRIMGIILPAMVTGMVALDLITGPERKKTLVNFGLYLLITAAVLYLSWPWLWEDPVGRFRIAFHNMSKFRWNNNVLLNGDFVRASEVGWSYLPRWFGLTTPIAYLILGLSGFVFLAIRFLRTPFVFLRNTAERNHLIHFLAFAGPVLVVILMHSVLYDAWRQMYFIYPAFLLMAIYGFSSLLKNPLFNSTVWRSVLLSLLFVSLAGTAFTMIRSHPFEDVYFNLLLSKDDQYLRKTYELDYWGTSYKQALEFITRHDTAPLLKIQVANLPGEHNAGILKPSDRARIRFASPGEPADYFITNYRWHPQDYPLPENEKIFHITVQHSEICAVWKLK